jgi:hypothetical protein
MIVTKIVLFYSMPEQKTANTVTIFCFESFHNMFQSNGNLSNIFFKGKILSEKTIINSDSLISKFISINSMSTNEY